jgi:hypothetical protein
MIVTSPSSHLRTPGPARESGLRHSGSDVALKQPIYDDRAPAASGLKFTIEQLEAVTFPTM